LIFSFCRPEESDDDAGFEMDQGLKNITGSDDEDDDQEGSDDDVEDLEDFG
jgi:hypothetical protein